jgi:hypothetical protein
MCGLAGTEQMGGTTVPPVIVAISSWLATL